MSVKLMNKRLRFSNFLSISAAKNPAPLLSMSRLVLRRERMLNRHIESAYIVPTLLLAAVLGFGPVAFAALMYDPVSTRVSPPLAAAFCFSLLVAARYLIEPNLI